MKDDELPAIGGYASDPDFEDYVSPKLPPLSQQDRSVSQPGKEIGNIFDLYINEEITKEEAIKRVKDLSQPSQPGEGKGDEYNPKPGQYGNRQFKKLAEGDFSNAEAPERLLPEQGNETRSMNSIMDDNVTMFNSGIPLWDKHAVNKCCREWEAALKSRPSEGWSDTQLKDFAEYCDNHEGSMENLLKQWKNKQI